MQSRLWLPLFLLRAVSAQPTSFTGDGTAYSSDWVGGNCGFTSLWGSGKSAGMTYFAAINAPQWDDAMNCGRCARVECTSAACKGSSVVVLLTNQCPECHHGSLDFSNQAFAALTGLDPTRVSIAWDFVPCPTDYVSGPIEYFVDGGSNNFWVGLQPRNFGAPIASLEVKTANDDTWHRLSPPSENSITTFLFVGEFASAFPPGPFDVRVTSTDGQVVLDTLPGLAVGQTLVGTRQFSGTPSGHPSTSPPVPASSTAPKPLTTPTPTPAPTPTSTPTPTSVSPASTPGSSASSPTPTTSAVPTLTTTPVASTPPVTLTPATTPQDMCADATYALSVWPGGFALHVYLTAQASAAWRLDVRAAHVASVSDAWNCIAHAVENASMPTWTLTSQVFNLALPSGANSIGVRGTTLDTTVHASVVDVTLTVGAQTTTTCLVPAVVASLPILPSPAASPVASQASPIASQASSTTTTLTADTREMTYESPAVVFGLIVAGAATVVAIAVIAYMRRAARREHDEKHGALLTPTHFSLETPMTIATL
ncbi:hypothetical protein SPRG_10926 [Saprolegnia parasitica CBS 223.65]|uniref:Expansin-like EG45 domain-containing protein n=1 Tax=Saprolegnia parasitica (strain CBS 223.65) TaxID=695850 RepID=A0A067BV12_SAPPC|nr:hypothetical protein SPRG_10926 [Saprolegnia parasitica CBS 223.65]KDO22108.1 hypothetical protein SPRG_10926 [Saprolegnia parasitica CBS 223.65]|eukprot:XP_012207148.1 hypothetical protein SPRG_10926 [Saprolegnia parasitica CBS 223.65]